MGNQPTRLGLTIGQSSYEAGQLMEGRIYLQVNRETPARSLQLNFVGEEFCVIVEKGDSDNDEHRETARSPIIQLQVPMAQFPTGTSQPGQYEFPFALELPSTLPSTTRCKSGKSICEVRYKLEARLSNYDGGGGGGYVFGGGGGVNNNTFARNSSRNAFNNDRDLATQVVTIHAIPTSEPQRQITLPEEDFPVHTCCCFRKGHMRLGAEVSRFLVSPQDPIEVNFSCVNASRVKVNQVKVTLTEIVEWNAQGQMSKKDSRVLATKEIDGESIPELAPMFGAKKRFGGGGGDSRSHSSNNNNPSSYYESAAVAAARRDTVLRMTQWARDTYQGNLIRVRHILKVTLVTPGLCCITSPEAATLLHVQRRAQHESVTVASSANTPVINSDEEALYNKYSRNNNSSSNSSSTHQQLPHAQASLVLPDDWHAQTADVVQVPMAQALVLGAAGDVQKRHPGTTTGEVVVPPTTSTVFAAAVPVDATAAATTTTTTTSRRQVGNSSSHMNGAIPLATAQTIPIMDGDEVKQIT